MSFAERIHGRFPISKDSNYADKAPIPQPSIPEPPYEDDGKFVSILMVTLDRYDLLAKCVEENLAKAGYPFELLCCDNGSTDQRVIEYVDNLQPAYHRINETNLGYAPCLNQMLLRAKGDYICIADPDITLPNYWLRKLVAANKDIPDSGISGYHCVEALPDECTVYGHRIRPGDVFGIKFFNRRVLNEVGYLCEDYSPYGLEDRDYLERLKGKGFICYYIADGKSEHIGQDVDQKNEYREMKWKNLERVYPTFCANMERYKATQEFYLPPPELKWE